MSGISVGTHQNQYYLNDKTNSVAKVDQLTDTAIAEKGSWVSFSIKTPDGKSEKKFQVRAVQQNGTSPNYQVEVRRNNLLTQIRRAFSSIFSPTAKSDKPLLHFTQDLLSRYALSQAAIKRSSQSLKPATEHLFGATEISQASKPFIDEHGYHVVMAPSQVISRLNQQPGSDEPMAVIFDLDDTLYTEGDYDGSEIADHTKSLDPELPQKLETFKRKFPNAKLIVITQSPYAAKGLVESKLAQCGYKTDIFDVLNTRGDPSFKGPNGQVLVSKNDRFAAILTKEKEKSDWSPQRVMFFDDNYRNLDALKNASDSVVGVKYEGYHVQSAQHFTELKHQKIPTVGGDRVLQRSELAQLEVTEKDLTSHLRPEHLHRYRMLRR